MSPRKPLREALCYCRCCVNARPKMEALSAFVTRTAQRDNIDGIVSEARAVLAKWVRLPGASSIGTASTPPGVIYTPRGDARGAGYDSTGGGS